MRLSVALFALLAMAAPAAADDVELKKAEAFLVLSQSGKLTADIMPPAQTIGFWNTIAGGGGAREGGNDVLVVLHFHRLKQNADKHPLVFRVTDDKGRQLLQRKNFDLWYGGGTDASKAFLLEGVGCTYLKLDIGIGKKFYPYELPFACGE